MTVAISAFIVLLIGLGFGPFGLGVVSGATNEETKPKYPNPNPNPSAQFLQPQNAARAAVKMPPLTWDPKLALYAQWWANRRKFDCALRHSNGPYGENIFWGSGSGWSPAQAAADWVSERRWYNYWSNSCMKGEMCGHYTQIIWRKTKKVGCASVKCYNGGGTFMICNYDPPGNYIGQRPY